MARTFRRKNFESTQNSSWDTRGFKTAGHYTTYDGPYWLQWGSRRMPNFRMMDAQERFHRWYWMHGESRSAQMRSPGRTYREWRMNQNRSINKQELCKWIKANGEYEPMFEENPRSCLWDWS